MKNQSIHLFILTLTICFYSSGMQKILDTTYSYAKTAQGNDTALKMDIYFEKSTGDNKPLIVMIHGGGFVGGDKKDAKMVAICTTMVKSGFVAASINYRLGMSGLDSLQAGYKAIYRAIEDMRAAVSFLLSSAFTLDASKIFIGGGSAGAITSLQTAYCSQADLMKMVDTTGCSNPVSPHAQFFKPAGVINLWGALLDSTVMNTKESPVISVHGTLDSTVPFDAGYMGKTNIMPAFGSAVVHRQAQRLGIYSELYSDTVGHGQFPISFYLPKIQSFINKIIGTTLIVTPEKVLPSTSIILKARHVILFSKKNQKQTHISAAGKVLQGNNVSGVYVIKIK